MKKTMTLLFFLLPILAFTQTKYQCLPCGRDCDKETVDKPGKCTHCQMNLVDVSTIKFTSIQPAELCSYIKSHPTAILLDVRRKEEFEGKTKPFYGTLQNAINIPIQELEEKVSTISNLKHREIIVYCSHSRRSPQASYLLGTKGFQHVINMEGGLSVMTDSTCIIKK